MKKRAAFIGLATWDIIYRVDHVPALDEKVVAEDAAMNAGGPATNAAVTFSALGGDAFLVSCFGSGPLAKAIIDDVASCSVTHYDLSPATDFVPPVSSAFLTKGAASRALVSLNGSRIPRTADWNPEEALSGCGVVLVDGHYMDAALRGAKWAASAGIPVVLDGGSWKPGTEELLPYCKVVIASARFHPPCCTSKLDTLRYLSSHGVEKIAVTDGALPITAKEGDGELTVPTFSSTGLDTTGAGDVFHGAFCYYLAAGFDFAAALSAAAKVAARKCDFLGARSWLKEDGGEQVSVTARK